MKHIHAFVVTAESLATIALHPIQSWESIDYITKNIPEVTVSLSTEIAKSFDEKVINGTAEERAEYTGRAMFEIGSLMISTSIANKGAAATKAAETAKIVGTTVKAGPVVKGVVLGTATKTSLAVAGKGISDFFKKIPQKLKNGGGFRLAFADGIDDFITKKIEPLMPDNPNKKMATPENGELGSGVNISGPKSEANISKVQGDTPSSSPKGNGKTVTVLKETDKFIDYVNSSGKTVRVPKQSPTNILDSINQKLKSTDSGTKIEAKVADYVSKNTNAQITDFGNKVKTPTGEIIGDIDCGTVNELIEVKKSISSVKVKQCDKYVNAEVSDYLNVKNKKVIMYIDEPVDMSNVHNINKISQLKEKGVIVVNSLEELKGMIQ